MNLSYSNPAYRSPFVNLGANRNMGQITEGVGVLPLIPLAIGGAALLGGGAVAGYMIGKPEYDQFGNPIPGPVDRIAKGIGNAAVAGVVLLVGYNIFVKETDRRKRRKR